MASHDEFEVQVGMRAHGALDAAAGARLDEHLASCASCRAFAEGARQQETAMKTAAETVNQTVDWDRIRAGIGRIDRRYRHYLTWAPVVAISLVLTPLVLHGTARVALVPFSIAMLVIVGAQTMEARRRRREAASFETERAGALGFWRGELDARIRQLGPASTVELFGGASVFLLACIDPTVWSALCAVALLGDGAYRRFVELPRLRRERAQLD